MNCKHNGSKFWESENRIIGLSIIYQGLHISKLVTLHTVPAPLLAVHTQVSYAKCCSSLFPFITKVLIKRRSKPDNIIQPSNTNMNTTHGTTHPTHSTGHTTHSTRTVSPANSCSSLFTITAKVKTTKVDHSNSKVAFTSHHSPDTNFHQTNSKYELSGSTHVPFAI